MASQQFCLRWNNYQSNLMQVFDQLLQTESFVDVTLSCEGQNVKAHRMVLSACSPYFQCLLNDTPCSHPVIILQGVKWTELKAVVEFMYKGEINICQEQLGSLLRVAESLKIRGLAEVDGDGAEPAVLASPSVSPAARAPSNPIDDSSPSSGVPRKRRRHSGDDASRPCTPLTPISAPELMDGLLELPASFMRNTIPTPLPSSPAGLNSLATRLPGPMPPPAPMPPHLPHLPPLSPLLNMHTMPRPHAPDDFEIRPGIAEMIREEERRRRDAPDMAKLLESSHHWMGTSMADGGGSVFPTMFAEPPAETPAPSTTTSAATTTVAAATTAVTNSKLLPSQKMQTPSLPLSLCEDGAASITRSIGDGGSSGCPSSSDTLLTLAPSILNTTTTITNTNSNNNNNISINNKNHKKHTTVSLTSAPGEPSDLPPAVLTLAGHFPGNTKASRGRSSPTQGLAGGGAGASVGILTSSRDDGGGGMRAVDCTWDDLRGAISAPKSGASRWTQNDLMAALTLVKAGTPIKPAAERCNIPVMTLWRRTRALGIVSSKVQCGFRYPAARRRPRADHESSTHVKMDAELSLPVKTETDGLTAQKMEPNAALKVQPDGGLLRCPSGSWTTVSTTRAGPLREMTVHAPRRIASRESSPRPAGRENSPMPSGRAGSSRPAAAHTTQTVKKNNRASLEDENTTIADSVPSPSPTLAETNLAPQEPQITETEAAPKPANEGNSILGHDGTRGHSARASAGDGEGETHTSPQLPTTSASGRSERFRAWVDIVLEGAGSQKQQHQQQQQEQQQHQQQETPQDLSTHHQRPSTSLPEPPPTFATVVTTAAAVTAPDPSHSPSAVHH